MPLNFRCPLSSWHLYKQINKYAYITRWNNIPKCSVSDPKKRINSNWCRNFRFISKAGTSNFRNNVPKANPGTLTNKKKYFQNETAIKRINAHNYFNINSDILHTCFENNNKLIIRHFYWCTVTHSDDAIQKYFGSAFNSFNSIPSVCVYYILCITYFLFEVCNCKPFRIFKWWGPKNIETNGGASDFSSAR